MHSFFFASVFSFSQLQYCDQYHCPKLTVNSVFAGTESFKTTTSCVDPLDFHDCGLFGITPLSGSNTQFAGLKGSRKSCKCVTNGSRVTYSLTPNCKQFLNQLDRAIAALIIWFPALYSRKFFGKSNLEIAIFPNS